MQPGSQSSTDESAAEPAAEIALRVEGMTCATCAHRVEKALGTVDGVRSARVNLALESARVELDPRLVSIEALRTAVDRAGFDVTLQSSDPARAARQEAERELSERRRRHRELLELLAAAALSAPLVMPMLLMPFGINAHWPPWFEFLLAAPVQLLAGARFYRGAWAALRARSGNMDLLVALGTSAAFGYSLYLWAVLGPQARGQLYFEAAAVLVTLIRLGKWLELRAKHGTSRALRELVALQPETARVLREDREIELPLSDVQPLDLCVIRPGERIPVDGTIQSGQSEVDESLITGESMPVAKQARDVVTGGSLNGTGLLRVRVTRVGDETTLSRMVDLVERAQSGRAPVQRFVDRVSALFVPAVLSVALVTFLVRWSLGPGLGEALVSSVAVLVIACPCALGLATPTAIVTAMGCAARQGLLFRDVESLERAAHVRWVVFDKTGTLTLGTPTVRELHSVHWAADSLLQLAASVQTASEHPLARAMVRAAEARSLELHPVTNFRSHTGLGVTARVCDRALMVGSLQWLASMGALCDSEAEAIERWTRQGWTSVGVAERHPGGSRLLGSIAIADELRPQSTPAVEALLRQGVNVELISGDAEAVTATVAREAGIERWAGGVLPADKVSLVERRRAAEGSVAMVGDGINDAPALAAADVGFAMGSGADVAVAAASVTLMRPDPHLVGVALDLARRTRTVIRQNLFWALIYNSLGIPIAAMGWLNPMVAGAAMALSSASVVSNSLRLRK